MARIDYYQSIVDKVEECVHELNGAFPKPVFIEHGQGIVPRHHPSQRSNYLACYLKAVRLVSLLNASLCLMRDSYVQESHILERVIDETAEDITFLAMNIGEGGSPRQQQMVNDFYQEESLDPLNPSSRNPVVRDKVRSAISNMSIEASDPHTRRQVSKSIYQLFSGFVHGAYVFIMEMYNPAKQSYEMHGLQGSPRQDDCEINFANHLYRAIMAAEIVAGRVDRTDIVKRLIDLNHDMATKTGCVDEEVIASIQRRRTLYE